MLTALNKILPWSWALVWFTIPFPLKANSLSLIIFGLLVFVLAFYKKPEFGKKQIITTVLFMTFFAWHAVSYFFDIHTDEVLFNLEKKLAFIAVPLIFLLMDTHKAYVEKWAVGGFFAGLLITGLHMVALALFKLSSGLDFTYWSYHAFTDPYPHGAIYYSWYLSSAILYLTYHKPSFLKPKWRISLLLFFLLLLFLCASKFFIALTIPLILWKFGKYVKSFSFKKKIIALFAGFAFLAIGLIPFMNRISELSNTKIEVLELEKYTYDTPFNGATFRMLQWRLAFEILNENKAWISGVGTGSRQEILNERYKNYGIYLGNPDLGDTGYLNYNFHNQYLETLVGTGIPGLVLLLLLIINMFATSKGTLLFPLSFYAMTGLFFVIESVLERQSGIIFFCLISCLIIFRNPSATYTIGYYNSH